MGSGLYNLVKNCCNIWLIAFADEMVLCWVAFKADM